MQFNGSMQNSSRISIGSYNNVASISQNFVCMIMSVIADYLLFVDLGAHGKMVISSIKTQKKVTIKPDI